MMSLHNKKSYTLLSNCSEALLHLSLIDGVGSVTIDRLVAQWGLASIDVIYTVGVQDLVACGIGQAKARAIVTGLANTAKVEAEYARAQKHNITIITRADDIYPQQLQHIMYPPAVLYVAGNVHALTQQGIAFVGARRAGSYARTIMRTLVPDVIAAGFSVVSGGAVGADTYAHQQAVDCGGVTVAVLGSGLLKWYPARNKQLFSDIIASGGALVSAFSLQTAPLAGNFPARNRIIAGLAFGCCVVQAAAKSGALGTAAFALEQGKEVFAVPGLIDDPFSQGCHQLIQQGATLVHTGHDIVQVFQEGNDVYTGSQALKTYEQVGDDADTAAILQLLAKPVPLQHVVDELAMPLHEVQDVLFDLLMQNRVLQTNGGLWQRI